MIESFRTIFAPPRDLILLVAALWIGLALAEKRSERHSISKEVLNNITFYSILGYIIGGRVLFALANYSAFAKSPVNILSINIDLFDPIGGLLTAILVGIVFTKRQNTPLWRILDALTPVFALLAIGLHLSHLASGSAYGKPTGLPWGIELWNASRHPTQLYELVASLVIFGIIWFRKSDMPPGILFLNFTAFTAGARLFLEAYRGDSTLVTGELRLAQITSWVFLALSMLAGEALRQKFQPG